MRLEWHLPGRFTSISALSPVEPSLFRIELDYETSAGPQSLNQVSSGDNLSWKRTATAAASADEVLGSCDCGERAGSTACHAPARAAGTPEETGAESGGRLSPGLAARPDNPTGANGSEKVIAKEDTANGPIEDVFAVVPRAGPPLKSDSGAVKPCGRVLPVPRKTVMCGTMPAPKSAAAASASDGRGQQHVALDGVALAVRNSHQIRPHLPGPLPGRTARGLRERCSAKECVGSNRARQERLQLPAATTTETMPEPVTTATTHDASVTDEQEQAATPSATAAQKPEGSCFPLDKLFQERSGTPK
jgi:hypothetical protein